MPKCREYFLVLWGAQFDEAVATIFITQLREAGLRVKVVGLTPPYIRGSHGLALVPDLTLDDALALAAKTRCIVLPNDRPGLGRLKSDPRLSALFQQAIDNKAKIVVGPRVAPTFDDLFLTSTNNVLIYPTENLNEFVNRLVDLALPYSIN